MKELKDSIGRQLCSLKKKKCERERTKEGEIRAQTLRGKKASGEPKTALRYKPRM